MILFCCLIRSAAKAGHDGSTGGEPAAAFTCSTSKIAFRQITYFAGLIRL
jgi:hypothetical protein